MSGESPKKIGRGYARDLEAGQFQLMIDSCDLHLRPRSRPRRSELPPEARRAREARLHAPTRETIGSRTQG
jgi:hypothetical protein